MTAGLTSSSVILRRAIAAVFMPQSTTLLLRRPVPRRQRGKVFDFVIVDAGEHISKPGLRIDAVQARGLNQRIHDCCSLAPRSEPQNSHDLRPSAMPRNSRSAALLKGMVFSTLRSGWDLSRG
jgi:hypothetical protein